MEKSQAILLLKVSLRPSVATAKITPSGQYIHTCKKFSTFTRFIEAIEALNGEIINQEAVTGNFVTIAILPPTVVNLITPGTWGGSKPGRIYKARAKADRKLDVRLNDKHVQLLEALALKWYGPRANSKTIRRLIEEAAEKEGVTI